MKDKRIDLHKYKLLNLVLLLIPLLFLTILFSLGHIKTPAIESCTGIIKNIGDGNIALEVLTGKHTNQMITINNSNTASLPSVGDTVALQIQETDNTLSAYLISGYATYETGIVQEIISEAYEQDSIAENTYRGEQTLAVTIKSGQYAGMSFMVSNTIGPTYNQPMQLGDKVSVILSIDADGTIRGSIYEYHRATALYIILGIFALLTLLVGGKTGAKSLLGLIATLLSLVFILLPLLLKGYPTLLTTFVICVNVTLLSLVLLGGVQKKTICAFLGTVLGMGLAMLFAILSQKLTRIDGLRVEHAEALLQLRQTGISTVGIKNIVTAGVMISGLGAVMDVAMSISSSMTELNRVNPNLTRHQLWTSGMHIGRDMVGTMTNTLVLAIFGSSLMLIIYLYSLNLSANQLMSSSYLSLELISSIASSIGIILSVPLTVTICVLVLKKKK